MIVRELVLWRSALGALLVLPLGLAGCIVGFQVESSTSASGSDSMTTAKASESGSSSSGSSSSATDGSGGESASSGSSGSGSTAAATDASSGSTGSTGATAATTESESGGQVGECSVDADCQLYSDCCSCQAAPIGEQVDQCDAACDVERCEAIGIAAAVCRFGVCVTERTTCDDSKVTCDAPVPECGQGLVPQVNAGGDCYTGLCVRGIHCDVVPNCDACPETEWTCVTYQAFTATHVCEPIPAACEGTASCACAAESVCDDVFSACSEGVDGLVCSCPDC